MKKRRGHILMYVPCFESVLHGEICGTFTWVQSFKCNFQSALHDNSNTWADAGLLKVKYLVNAGNFKHNLQSAPLIF